MPTIHKSLVLTLCCALPIIAPLGLAQSAAKPEPDVLVFANGEKLVGKLVRSNGSTVTFHSDSLGDVKADWSKIQELRSSQKFVVVAKGVELNRHSDLSKLPTGPVVLAGKTLTVGGQTVPVAGAAHLIDQPSFEQAVLHSPGFFEAWTGSLTAGASLVEATQKSQSFTGGIGLLRREIAQPGKNVMSGIASGAAYLNAFTPLDNLPTLKVLPGLITDDLGDEVLQQEGKVAEVIQGLYEAGVAAGGVVIMDVGINPAHVVHRAVLKAAEGIAIVIKPEIPDLAETRRWIARMINSLANVVGKSSAHEFIGSRVKLCYNQVVGDGFKSAHKLLQQALNEDKIDLALIPNGILPIVDPRLAAQAVNSDRREDILIWRYKKEKLEELGPFADALLGFAAHFVPAVREGAMRVGLLPNFTKKRGLFGK